MLNTWIIVIISRKNCTRWNTNETLSKSEWSHLNNIKEKVNLKESVGQTVIDHNWELNGHGSLKMMTNRMGFVEMNAH